MTSAPPPGRNAWPPSVVAALRCPLCGSPLIDEGGRLVCTRRHSFDRARQGLVTLRDGHAAGVQADTAEMVEARVRLLGAGTYGPLSRDLAATAAAFAPAPAELVVDLAGGTGHHLAEVLGILPEAHGLDLDLSTAALRRAARLHPRLFAVGADLMRPLPLADGCASMVMSAFGPRPADEVRRVLAPGAPFIVAMPTAEHLAEVARPLGMLAIDAEKEERLLARLERFTLRDRHVARFPIVADHALLRDMVAMGPSAHHTTETELDARVRALPSEVTVHASVEVLTFTCS